MYPLELRRLVDEALIEDVGTGDVTTDSVVPSSAMARGEIVAKASGIVAGLSVAGMCFTRLDSNVIFEAAADGTSVSPGQVLATLSGPAAPILRAERVALNFIQRLSGIATLTARYVEAVADYPVKILDTRKTTPGLRSLEKYAVRMGGGFNHRVGLYDGILIKDNHLMFQDAGEAGQSQGNVKAAVLAAKRSAGHLQKVEVEADTLEQVKEAVGAGADAILLDNMNVETLARAVESVRNSGRQIVLEASGNVLLSNVAGIAATGVDAISVGALTHSAPSLDISLELQPA